MDEGDLHVGAECACCNHAMVPARKLHQTRCSNQAFSFVA